jgi:endoglucanase
MKITRLAILLLVAAGKLCYGQGSLEEDFNDNVLNGWTNTTAYTATEINQETKVAVDKPAGWATLSYTFPEPLNLSKTPYLKIRIKASASVPVRIDLKDVRNKVTNKTEVTKTVTTSYVEYTYKFTGTFYQMWPNDTSRSRVDSTRIKGFDVIINPGASATFKGTVYFDDLKVGKATGILPPPSIVMANQLGFYPDEKKVAVVNSLTPTKFYVIKSDGDTVKEGNLSEPKYWTPGADTVRRADFSDVTTPGTYKVAVPGIGSTFDFEIREKVHADVLRGGLKSYYFQRASMPLEAAYAGKYARPAGTPDNIVWVHGSAASESTPEFTEFSSPGGWYDAGDYGKYVVNSGISTYQLIALWEHYPKFFDTLNLNIPESGNNIPDILDEALYNVKWMLTMQDKDGGVFNKLTPLRHDNIVMPQAADDGRFLFQKSTAATLDFAAVMAQAARVYKNYESTRELADSFLAAARKAYEWAVKNPEEYFTTNPSGVNTGTYGDSNPYDEFVWARAELLISTMDTIYIDQNDMGASLNIPGWNNVAPLAFVTYAHHKKVLAQIPGHHDTTMVKDMLLYLADEFYDYYLTNGFGIPYGSQSWHFTWGGNAIAGNQGFLLLQAYRHNPDKKGYFDAALANLDYLLGRNPTNYSFVTGYGDKPVMHLHHRPSEADGIDEPIPGFIAGGPHNGNHSGDCPEYPSSVPAKMYLDATCSFSTNENAINYNSAFVSLAGGIEAIRANASSFPTAITEPVSGKNKTSVSELHLYPNPSTDNINFSINASGLYTAQITDLTGKTHYTGSFTGNGLRSETINTINLEKGIYFIQVTNGNEVYSEKFVIQ